MFFFFFFFFLLLLFFFIFFFSLRNDVWLCYLRVLHVGHVTLCVREIDYSELTFLAVVFALSAQCAAMAEK